MDKPFSRTLIAYRTPCCFIGHQVLPTKPLLSEAKDLPRAGKYSKDVPLSAYLDYLQSI